MDSLLAFIGGAGMWVGPYSCLRALAVAEPDRATAIGYSVLGVVILLAGAVLASDSLLVALVGFAAAALVTRLVYRKAKVDPDFVVEGPLLEGAVSPELAAELSRVEEAAREHRLEEMHPDLPPAPKPRH